MPEKSAAIITISTQRENKPLFAKFRYGKRRLHREIGIYLAKSRDSGIPYWILDTRPFLMDGVTKIHYKRDFYKTRQIYIPAYRKVNRRPVASNAPHKGGYVDSGGSESSFAQTRMGIW